MEVAGDRFDEAREREGRGERDDQRERRVADRVRDREAAEDGDGERAVVVDETQDEQRRRKRHPSQRLGPQRSDPPAADRRSDGHHRRPGEQPRGGRVVDASSERRHDHERDRERRDRDVVEDVRAVVEHPSEPALLDAGEVPVSIPRPPRRAVGGAGPASGDAEIVLISVPVHVVGDHDESDKS